MSDPWFGVWSHTMLRVEFPHGIADTERVIDLLHARLADMFMHRVKLYEAALMTPTHYMPNSDNLYSMPSIWGGIFIGGVRTGVG